MSGEINWGEPIEAYHTDGRVVPVTLVATDHQDPYTPRKISPRLTNPDAWWFQEDGLWDSKRALDWRIRNVAQAASQPRTAPSGGEVGPEVVDVHDLREARRQDAVLWDRMEAFVRAAAERDDSWGDDARAIVSLLPEPVDTDLVEARRIALPLLVSEFSAVGKDVSAGGWDSHPMVEVALEALRSRSLEKGEAA